MQKLMLITQPSTRRLKAPASKPEPTIGLALGDARSATFNRSFNVETFDGLAEPAEALQKFAGQLNISSTVTAAEWGRET